MRILYLSCETFTNHFVTAVANGELDNFRFRYRHVDVLLIDDIHFLANRERTQEEFFHTFNTLYNANKQIILSSDSTPGRDPDAGRAPRFPLQVGHRVAHRRAGVRDARRDHQRARSRMHGLVVPRGSDQLPGRKRAQRTSVSSRER